MRELCYVCGSKIKNAVCCFVCYDTDYKFGVHLNIAVGKQSSLGGTMNLPKCSNQNISKCTKIFLFILIGLRWIYIERERGLRRWSK